MQFSSKDEQRRSHQADLREWLKGQGMTMRSASQWPAPVQTPLVDKFLDHFSQIQSAGLWGIFVPLPSEPPVDVFCRRPSSIRWCFPRTVEGGLEMRHTFFAQENFEFGPLGVWEPQVARSSLVERDQLKGVFVPGVGFDQQGRRLGRGGGYYDRFLQGFKGRRIAVAYSCQMSREKITTDHHDQTVDEIWTEHERIVC